MVTRSLAIVRASDYFDSGDFLADLARRVAFRTESGVAAQRPELLAYLEQEMVPAALRLGADARVLDNPDAGGGPLLIAHRHEGDSLPTVLTYGHADVVLAEPGRWRAGLDPWRVTTEQDRWYGRGTADNKGQHTINLAALEHVLAARGGRLGFNLKILIETSEETGSQGLGEFCARHAGDDTGHWLEGVAPSKVSDFAGEAAAQDVDTLSRYGDAKKVALVACLVRMARQKARDDLAEMLCKRVASITRRRRRSWMRSGSGSARCRRS
jgi:hypothetical protein